MPCTLVPSNAGPLLGCRGANALARESITDGGRVGQFGRGAVENDADVRADFVTDQRQGVGGRTA
jgi:hypothetical protein